MSITIKASDLRRALRATRPATEGGSWGPPLYAVHLEAGGGMLAATATDRYIAARARVPSVGTLEPLLLHRDEARNLSKALRHHGDKIVELGADDRSLEVRAPGITWYTETEDARVWPAAKVRDTFARAGDETVDKHAFRHLFVSMHNMRRLSRILRTLEVPDVDFAGTWSGTAWTMRGQFDAVLIEPADWLAIVLMPMLSLPGQRNPSEHMPYDLPVGGEDR